MSDFCEGGPDGGIRGGGFIVKLVHPPSFPFWMDAHTGTYVGRHMFQIDELTVSLLPP